MTRVTTPSLHPSSTQKPNRWQPTSLSDTASMLGNADLGLTETATNFTERNSTQTRKAAAELVNSISCASSYHFSVGSLEAREGEFRNSRITLQCSSPLIKVIDKSYLIAWSACALLGNQLRSP